MSISRKGYNKKLYRMAQQNGWKVPVNDRHPPEVWNGYWEAMRLHAEGKLEGRPIPPHITGGSKL